MYLISIYNVLKMAYNLYAGKNLFLTNLGILLY